jgi:hypothetical protein
LSAFRKSAKQPAAPPAVDPPVEAAEQPNPPKSEPKPKKKKKPFPMLRLLEFDADGYYPTLVTQWRVGDAVDSVMALKGQDGVTRVLCQLWRHGSVRIYAGELERKPVDPSLEKWVPVPVGGENPA